MRKRKYSLLIIIVFIFLGIVYFFWKKPALISPKINYKIPSTYDAEIIIGKNRIFVQVAKTSEEITKGLSGKKDLIDDEGMIFILSSKTYPLFWMKGMLFPIDIIWIADNKIVKIDTNVPVENPDTPERDYKLYQPGQLVDHVLEVQADSTKEKNIRVGDNVIFTDL